MSTDATYRRITEKQLAFLLALRTEKGLEDRFSPEQAALLSVEAASRWISKALTLPDVGKTEAPTGPNTQPRYTFASVPQGRYAIEHEGTLKFYQVDVPTEGKWMGFTFLKVQASDETYPIKGRAKQEILKLIAVNPQAAAIRYGQEIGSCGVCGRTLTNEVSREYGIGPVCREATGW